MPPGIISEQRFRFTPIARRRQGEASRSGRHGGGAFYIKTNCCTTGLCIGVPLAEVGAVR